MAKPITIRFGPFTGGINRLKDRTSLSNTELYDARGVFQKGRGRLRACWEANTTTAAFSAMTNAATTTSPRQVIYWREAAKLVAANQFTAEVEDANQLLASATATQPKADLHCIEYNQKLFVFKDNEPARFYRKGSTGHSYTSTESHVDQFDTGPAWNYGGITCATPTAAMFHPWFANIKGKPFFLYHSYWDAKVEGATEAGPRLSEDKIVGITASGDINEAGGAHGSGNDYTTFIVTAGSLTVVNAYATNVHVYGGPQNAQTGRDPNPNEYLYSYMAFLDTYGGSPGTADTSIYAMSDVAAEYTRVNMRCGHPNQQFMGRFPTVYKNRLCVVEGREYDYTRLDAGVASYLSYSTANRLTTSVDLTSSIGVGDEIIVFSTAAFALSSIKDYVITGDNDTALTKLTIEDIDWDGANTNIDITGHGMPAVGFVGTYCARKALTKEKRRAVWFAGRAANTPVGLSADITDAAKWESLNNVIVGTDSEGDIVGTFGQGEYRLLVFLEGALYQIVGDPPLDGVAPPGFAVTRIGSIGGHKHLSVAADDTGQVVYFAGHDGGVYALYGQQTQDISAQVYEHGNWPRDNKFSHLVYHDKRLYCLEDVDSANDPVIWIFDTLSNSWTWTRRQNNGSSESFTTTAITRLYNASGDHGGLFAPFQYVNAQADLLLAAFKATNYKIRPMNSGTEETDAAYLHGVRIQTGFVDGDIDAPKRIRRTRVLNTKILDNGYDSMKIDYSSGEGTTTLTRTGTPEWTSLDAQRYIFQGEGGKGEHSISMTLNDGMSNTNPLGELDSIELDVIPMNWRQR